MCIYIYIYICFFFGCERDARCPEASCQLRTEKEDLMYQATFNEAGIIHHLDRKRTGQPRKKWLQETMSHAFNQYVYPYLEEELQEDFNEFDPEHVQWLQEVAKQRLF